MQTIVVLLITLTLSTWVPPKKTCAGELNPEPLIISSAPPATGPADGVTWVTAGAAAATTPNEVAAEKIFGPVMLVAYPVTTAKAPLMSPLVLAAALGSIGKVAV